MGNPASDTTAPYAVDLISRLDKLDHACVRKPHLIIRINPLDKEFLDDFSTDIREAEVAALGAEGETLMVEAEAVE